MRMNYLGAAIAAAFIFSSSAQAANWELVATSNDGTASAYVEADRIVNGTNGKGAWVRLTQRAGDYYISLIAVRCDSMTFLEVKSNKYSSRGVSTSLQLSGNWDITVPGSLMDALLQRICQ